ncbi:MAG: lipoate--protein ligase [Bacteroidales bacterium]|nr:lipoate--protein ligase [Bacteroidales bacterium]
MKLEIIVSNQTNPFLNIAVEQHLVAENPSDTVVMYLWKNHRTVVIGLNQNPFAECDVETLLADGGHLMRRMTGGGAVYHDTGNLNFSFVVPKELYDVRRQFAVIQKAVEAFGLEAEISGRNDLLCQGRKFSGNAFSKGSSNNLHHGTLLINTDTVALQRYLKVKPSKLLKHGVASVQSRVVNLSELADITSENIVQPLKEAFCQVYGNVATERTFESVCTESVMKQSRDMASDDFLFARWRNFSTKRSGSFPWGEVEIALETDETTHTISRVDIATDCLSLAAVEQAQQLLQGASLSQPPQIPASDNDTEAIIKDIIALVYG